MLTSQDLHLKLQVTGAARARPAAAYDMRKWARGRLYRDVPARDRPEPWKAATCIPSRRQRTGATATSQPPAALLPIPGRAETFADDLQDLYLGSLKALGIDLRKNDVRFVEDDWDRRRSAPGSGLGVWLNGWRSPSSPTSAGRRPRRQTGLGELTYGLERLAMYSNKRKRLRPGVGRWRHLR